MSAALSPNGKILECTPWKREKTYLLKRTPEWDIHLPPVKRMVEAMESCGMRAVQGDEGLWERVAEARTSTDVNRVR